MTKTCPPRQGMRRLHRALASCLLLLPTSLRAAPSTAERAAAEALYEEGRRLLNEGRPVEACPKFEESQKLDPGIGTLLYLGSCYEKVGKLASAWITFREATSAARSAGQADREKIAQGRADALEGRLARLQLIFPPEQQVQGLEIRDNGVLFGKGLWGSAIPVDPGNHRIELTAPSYRPASLSITVDREGQTVTLRLPPLEPASTTPGASAAPPASGSAPPPPSAPPPTPPTPPSAPLAARPDRTLPLIAGGIGVLGVGVGAFLGLRAISQWDDSREFCPADRCNQKGYDLATSASRSGNLSTLFFAVGAVGLGTGATLWLLNPTPSTASRAPAFSVGIQGASLTARGSW